MHYGKYWKNSKIRKYLLLAIMNVTAVVSLRGLPAEAEYGLSSASLFIRLQHLYF